MIEFNGSLTGEAQKFFWKNSRTIVLNLLFVTFLLILPVILFIVLQTKYWELLIAYLVSCFVIFLLLFVPKSQKEKENFTPKRIFTEEEYIVCKN